MAGEGYNAYGFVPLTPEDELVEWRPIAAAQTWKRGDMTYLASGAVTLATSGSATLLGPAMDDQAAPTTGTLVPVNVKPHARYRGIVNANASAVTAGSEVDLTGATGAQMVNVGASSTDVLVFQGLLPLETSSSAYAYCVVTINDSKQDGI